MGQTDVTTLIDTFFYNFSRFNAGDESRNASKWSVKFPTQLQLAYVGKFLVKLFNIKFKKIC
jgi:hypothetical protein